MFVKKFYGEETEKTKEIEKIFNLLKPKATKYFQKKIKTFAYEMLLLGIILGLLLELIMIQTIKIFL